MGPCSHLMGEVALAQPPRGVAPTRRERLGRLLRLAADLDRKGWISKGEKGFLKELIVHQNERVLAVADRLVGDKGEMERELEVLRPLIKQRASNSYRELFDICSLENAHCLATAEAETLAKGTGQNTESLVYGEVEFDAFYDIVQAAVRDLQPWPQRERQKGAHAGHDAGDAGGAGEGDGLKMYDLGSGSGRAIFVAALCADFGCVVGIEVLQSMHEAAEGVLLRYRELVEPVLPSPAVIRLYHGSFLAAEFDWTDGDLVFANSTCFDDHTLRAIASKAVGLRAGAKVITFTVALRTLWLEVVVKQRRMMSWGPVTVFVHRKLSEEEYARRLVTPTTFDEDQAIVRRPAEGACQCP